MEDLMNKAAARSCIDQTDDEINLLDYWHAIWNKWWIIAGLALVTVTITGVVSLSMPNIYQARAVIMPVTSRDSAVGIAAFAQQFGVLPGISPPGSASVSEIVSRLKSNILRERIIRQYNLLPVLSSENGNSRGETGISLNILDHAASLAKAIIPAFRQREQQKDETMSETWEALRLLEGIIKINHDIRMNTVTLSADFRDPHTAAKLVEYFLVALTNYMSSEAKRVAATNQKHLEKQLGSTTDPFIKQKTYNMIAQQIEMGMLAEVKENFAFKVIDPPLAPDKKIRPKRVQLVILSFFAALFVGIGVALLLEYRRKRQERGSTGRLVPPGEGR